MVKLLFGCISLVLLPVIAVASAAAAVSATVSHDMIPLLQTAEAIADKSMAYWFISLAVVSIASWTWVFKWLIQLLGEQRTAHADATKQLVGHLITDHVMMVQVVTKSTEALEQLSKKLKS
jgi:hypothetical protein